MNDALLDLVDRIYEASLDNSLWFEAMARLSDLTGGAEATLTFSDLTSARHQVIAPRTDPDYLLSYREHWVGSNPLMHHIGKVPVGIALNFAEIVPNDDFARTPFYNEWWAPQGLGAGGMGITLMANRRSWIGCAIHPATGKRLGTQAEALMAVVGPHLSRAIDIQSRLTGPRSGAEGASTRIDQLRKRFGLTAAEAAFALEISRGDGREAAAKRCGISVSTAHTHLNRIFSKTGTVRQAELVRLLLVWSDAEDKATGR